MEHGIGETTGRNQYLDIVKYIAIFLVLWGHVVQQSFLRTNTGEAYIDINPNYDGLYFLIYTVHMPLFMGICGYFFARSVRRHQHYIRTKFFSRIRGLIIPMISIGFVKMFLSSVNHLENFNLRNWLMESHDIWFLGDLVINTVLIILILEFLNGKLRHDWIFFMIVWPLADIPKIGYGSQGVYMYMFFAAGYIMDYYFTGMNYIKYMKYLSYIIILYLISYILYSYMVTVPNFFIITVRHLDSDILVNDILHIIMAFSGAFIIMALTWKFMKYKKNGWIYHRAVSMGKYTLDIYLLNIIILETIGGAHIYPWLIKNVFHENILQSHGFIWEMVSTFLVACFFMEVIIVVSKLLNNYKITSKIFFYR